MEIFKEDNSNSLVLAKEDTGKLFATTIFDQLAVAVGRSHLVATACCTVAKILEILKKSVRVSDSR